MQLEVGRIGARVVRANPRTSGVIRRYYGETAGYGFASNPPYEAALRRSHTIIASSFCPSGKSFLVLLQAALPARPLQAQNPLRVKSNFARFFNVIWVVQSPREKYSACAVGQIKSKTRAVPPRQEGRMRYRHET
jgi:hypothetical protein